MTQEMKLQTSRYRLHEDKLWANGHGGGLCSVNKPAAAVFASSLSAVTSPQKVKRSPRSPHLPQQHVFCTHKSINCHPCSDVAFASNQITHRPCHLRSRQIVVRMTTRGSVIYYPALGGQARLVGCS